MLSKTDAIAGGHFPTYIQQAQDGDVAKSIRKNTKEFKKFVKSVPKKKRDYAYGEGKWTIREVLQHIIDAERVFVYRALTFARKDTVELPPFDENIWAANANFIRRDWDDLVAEFKALRSSTQSFFESLGDGELLATGVAGTRQINVLALGYVIAGHAAHHINITNERYL